MEETSGAAGALSFEGLDVFKPVDDPSAKRMSALDRLTELSEEAGGYAIDKNRR